MWTSVCALCRQHQNYIQSMCQQTDLYSAQRSSSFFNSSFILPSLFLSAIPSPTPFDSHFLPSGSSSCPRNHHLTDRKHIWNTPFSYIHQYLHKFMHYYTQTSVIPCDMAQMPSPTKIVACCRAGSVAECILMLGYLPYCYLPLLLTYLLP